MNAQEIKKLRAELGLSQSKLGSLFGYSDTAVMKWEQGKAVPTPVVMAALIRIRQGLDERKKKQKQEFINGLAATAVTGGVIAFLAYIFKD